MIKGKVQASGGTLVGILGYTPLSLSYRYSPTHNLTKERIMNVPNPGSDEAIEQNCTCPVMDNRHGAGIGNPPQFWITEGCPLHAPEGES